MRIDHIGNPESPSCSNIPKNHPNFINNDINQNTVNAAIIQNKIVIYIITFFIFSMAFDIRKSPP